MKIFPYSISFCFYSLFFWLEASASTDIEPGIHSIKFKLEELNAQLSLIKMPEFYGYSFDEIIPFHAGLLGTYSEINAVRTSADEELVTPLQDSLNELVYGLKEVLQSAYSVNFLELLKFVSDQIIADNPVLVMHIMKSLNDCNIRFEDDQPSSRLYLYVFKLVDKLLKIRIRSKGEWDIKAQGLGLFIEILKIAPGVQALDPEHGLDVPIEEYIAGLEYLKANSVFDEERRLFDVAPLVDNLKKFSIKTGLRHFSSDKNFISLAEKVNLPMEPLMAFYMKQYYGTLDVNGVDAKFLSTIYDVSTWCAIGSGYRNLDKRIGQITTLLNSIERSSFKLTSLPIGEWQSEAFAASFKLLIVESFKKKH